VQADPIVRVRLSSVVRFALPQKSNLSATSKHVIFPEPGHYETHALAWYLHACGQSFLDWFRAQDSSSDPSSPPSVAGDDLQNAAIRILDDYITDLRLNVRAAAKTTVSSCSTTSDGSSVASEQSLATDQEEVAMSTFSASFVRTSSLSAYSAGALISTAPGADPNVMPAPLMQVAVCMLLEKLRDISLHDSARIFFSAPVRSSVGSKEAAPPSSPGGIAAIAAPRFADIIYPKLLLLVKFGTPAIRIRLSKLLPNFIWFLRTQ
jgi:hypothetical protein